MNGIFELKGQRALVTGGGSGIGLAIAGCLADAGAEVILVGRDAAKLAAAVSEIGPLAKAAVHDVTDLAAAPAFAERVEREFGPVDILVNNAGINMKKPALETTDAEMQKIFDTNVFGSFALSRAFGRGMLARKRGNVLFIASMATLMGIPGVVAYSAAKSGIGGIVRTLAMEWSPSGVRVNAIAPGWIETAMSRKAMAGDPERKRKVLSRTPAGTFGRPEDVGYAAVYLSSPAAAYVTGVVLPVDGGTSIGF